MEDEKKRAPDSDNEKTVIETGHVINVSGHVQELDRSFGILSICAIGIMSNNAWGAGGGSLLLAIYNGGGPGVLYGLIAASFFYAFIGLSLAELSSAIPSSANVYHWAAVTAGSRGRICSFYAGWWNAIAWIFGTASVTTSGANAAMAIYALYNPAFTPERWQIFVAYVGITVIDGGLVLFGQKYLAKTANACGLICLAFAFVTILVVAIMPSKTGSGYATSSFVWSEFANYTGWTSNGFVFLMGMLNGAFAIGTPDGVAHMCEEIPNPRVNVPKGVAAQLIVGFLSTFAFYIAILYGITSLDDVFNTNIVSLPLAAMYQQATRSNAATTALLILFLINMLVCIPGAHCVAGRTLWTLARDDATPVSGWLRHVSGKWRNPFHAQLVTIACVIVLGCIYIGSATAFNAFVGSFAILTTMSYLSAILPHLLTGRKHVRPGPFWMGPVTSKIVMSIASAYIIVFNVIYMFPFAMPVDAATMNYASVMTGGITILLTGWYFWKIRNGYVGPTVVQEASDDLMVGMVGLTKAEEEARRQQVLSEELR